jgi:Zn finger protein HypA/HybF involved in hydrogenase expression
VPVHVILYSTHLLYVAANWEEQIDSSWKLDSIEKITGINQEIGAMKSVETLIIQPAIEVALNCTCVEIIDSPVRLFWHSLLYSVNLQR